MRRTAALLLLAAAPFAPAAVGGAVLLDTSLSFPGPPFLQGVDGLYYCSRPHGLSLPWVPLDLVGLPRPANSILQFGPAGLGALAFGQFVIHPGLSETHLVDFAKLWRSNASGAVLVSGEVIKQTNGGDGALFQLTLDGRLILSKVLKEQGDKLSFSEVVGVHVGSELAFVVNAVADADNDSLWTKFVIESSNQSATAHPLPAAEEPAGSCDMLPGPPARCAPRIFIVGAMKCGTNTLGTALAEHPAVVAPPFPGEPEYFYPYRHNNWTSSDYAAMFPDTDWTHNQTYDKSPAYLSSFRSALYIRKAVPRARIMIATCDPIARMWSHYWHMQSYETELAAFPVFRLPWDEFVKSVLSNSEEGGPLLRNGLYAPSISMWRHLFGGEAVHVWNREAYNADPGGTMAAVWAFLGLPPKAVDESVRAFEGHHESHPLTEMSETSRAALAEYYEGGAHSLAGLVRRSVGKERDREHYFEVTRGGR